MYVYFKRALPLKQVDKQIDGTFFFQLSSTKTVVWTGWTTEDTAKYRALWEYIWPVRKDNQAFEPWTSFGKVGKRMVIMATWPSLNRCKLCKHVVHEEAGLHQVTFWKMIRCDFWKRKSAVDQEGGFFKFSEYVSTSCLDTKGIAELLYQAPKGSTRFMSCTSLRQDVKMTPVLLFCGSGRGITGGWWHQTSEICAQTQQHRMAISRQ